MRYFSKHCCKKSRLVTDLFVRITLALCVCLTTRILAPFFGFCLEVFCQARLPQRVDCSPLGQIGVDCLFEQHKDI